MPRNKEQVPPSHEEDRGNDNNGSPPKRSRNKEPTPTLVRLRLLQQEVGFFTFQFARSD